MSYTEPIISKYWYRYVVRHFIKNKLNYDLNDIAAPTLYQSVWFPAMLNCGNEMNRVLGHICAHIGQTGPEEPPGDGEMNTALQTQDSKFVSRGVWDLACYLSVTEVPHNTEFYEWAGKKHFVSLKWGSSPRSPTFQAGSFNYCTTVHQGPRPCWNVRCQLL